MSVSDEMYHELLEKYHELAMNHQKSMARGLALPNYSEPIDVEVPESKYPPALAAAIEDTTEPGLQRVRSLEVIDQLLADGMAEGDIVDRVLFGEDIDL